MLLKQCWWKKRGLSSWLCANITNLNPGTQCKILVPKWLEQKFHVFLSKLHHYIFVENLTKVDKCGAPYFQVYKKCTRLILEHGGVMHWSISASILILLKGELNLKYFQMYVCVCDFIRKHNCVVTLLETIFVWAVIVYGITNIKVD